MLTFIIILIIAVWLILAVRYCIKRKKSGKCIGCSGDCSQCMQSCHKNNGYPDGKP